MLLLKAANGAAILLPVAHLAPSAAELIHRALCHQSNTNGHHDHMKATSGYATTDFLGGTGRNVERRILGVATRFNHSLTNFP